MSNAAHHPVATVHEKIAVVGAGAWGTTLAVMLSRKGLDTTLLTHKTAHAAEIRDIHENRKYLPEIAIPESMVVSSVHEVDTASATTIILVVPSAHVRAAAERLRPFINRDAIIISCAKGFEFQTYLRMTEVIAEATRLPDERICALSGPNLAREIAAGMPASSVVASASRETGRRAQHVLSSPQFRVYTSDDVVGVEYGGALKNVIALAAGAVDGLGAGQNAKASLMTRGLAEMTRLGVAAGAKAHTFSGLSGLGDLVATCESPLSRNRTFGERLGKGVAVDRAAGQSPHVVEGVSATRAAVALAERHNVEMPIARAVLNVLEGRSSVHDAVSALMTRDVRPELDDI